MIDFSKYDIDYEVPLNPANLDYIVYTDADIARSSDYSMQSDACLECADELAKWLHGNLSTINPYDYGIVLYLANHAVELKLKAFLIKIGNPNPRGHDCSKLIDRIPDKYFQDVIGGTSKQTLVDSIKSLNKYNTLQNELGRYSENKSGTRLASRKDGIVYFILMSTMYTYHQIMDLLDKNYRIIGLRDS